MEGRAAPFLGSPAVDVDFELFKFSIAGGQVFRAEGFFFGGP